MLNSKKGESVQFGMFGSAQARRSETNDDSGAGFREFVERNVEAEAQVDEDKMYQHLFDDFDTN